MKEMKIGEVTTKMEVAEAAETIGTRKVDVITTTQEVDASSPSAQMVTKMNAILYGANGIQTRIVSLADGLLMTQGGDKGSMEAALTAYDSNTNTLDDVPQGPAGRSPPAGPAGPAGADRQRNAGRDNHSRCPGSVLQGDG